MLLSTRDHGGVWFRFIAGYSGSDLKGTVRIQTRGQTSQVRQAHPVGIALGVHFPARVGTEESNGWVFLGFLLNLAEKQTLTCSGSPRGLCFDSTDADQRGPSSAADS